MKKCTHPEIKCCFFFLIFIRFPYSHKKCTGKTICCFCLALYCVFFIFLLIYFYNNPLETRIRVILVLQDTPETRKIIIYNVPPILLPGKFVSNYFRGIPYCTQCVYVNSAASKFLPHPLTSTSLPAAHGAA